MRTILAFVLGLVVTTNTVAITGAGGYQPGVTTPSMQGYTYNADTGRAEVSIDQFLPECVGATAILTVLPDRQTAELKCRRGLTDNWHSAQLPVFQANPQFAVTWSR